MGGGGGSYVRPCNKGVKLVDHHVLVPEFLLCQHGLLCAVSVAGRLQDALSQFQIASRNRLAEQQVSALLMPRCVLNYSENENIKAMRM